MDKKLKAGIIGCGFISKAHMEGYKKLGFVEQIAFCDLIPERAEQAARLYGLPGAKVFTDYRELLKLEDIDCVDVLTENCAHAGIAVDALKAGKHVMVEKPMSISPNEADLMVKTAKESGKKLTVGYHLRYSDNALSLRQMVQAGKLGEIYYVEAESLRRRGVPTWGVFLSMGKQGGGPLIDVGTHIVDLALWLMGDYSPVKSAVGQLYDKLIPLGGYNRGGPWDIGKFEVEDSAFGTVVLQSGATFVVKASWALNIDVPESSRNVLLYGTGGGATLEGADHSLRLNGEADDRLWSYVPDERPNRNVNLYDREMAYWANCLVDGTEPLVRGEEAAQVVKVLDALYRSAREGRALNFSDGG